MSTSKALTHELVLCTKDRPQSLRICLEHVLAAEPTPDRIIVVDSSAQDHTEALVHDLSKTGSGGRISYLRSAPGLTAQRNQGLDVVSGDVVHFLDDDAYVCPNYFGRILDAFGQDHLVVGVGGLQLVPHPPRTGRVRWLFFLSGPPATVTRAGVNIEGDARIRTTRSVHWLSGCAMSFRAHTARQVRFDEDLRGYALGEDLDFCLRIGNQGKLVIVPDALVKHERARVGGRPSLRQLARDDVVNRRRLVAEYPQRFSVVAYWWSVVGLSLLCVARLCVKRDGSAIAVFHGVMSGVIHTLRERRRW